MVLLSVDCVHSVCCIVLRSKVLLLVVTAIRDHRRIDPVSWWDLVMSTVVQLELATLATPVSCGVCV